jgi:N-acetylmuramidase
MISTVAELIAQAESSGNKFAVRYEKGHMPNLAFVKEMMAVAQCSFDSAYVMCQCSWGLYQIMGDELMAKKLGISPIAYCSDPETQQYFFLQVLQEKGLDHYGLQDIITNTDDRIHFAIKYNGPAQPEVYAQYLIDTYNKVAK